MTTPQTFRLSRRAVLGGAAAVGAGALVGCSPAQQAGEPEGAGASGAPVELSFRLWDEQLQPAYEASFAAFTQANPNITVTTTLVPWADYFNKLRTDITGGNADDLFLMNGSYVDPYISSNNLIEIGSDFDSLKGGWLPAAVEQYTRQGKLWGVPQLTDGGIAVYYNKELLDDAGVSVEEISNLAWGTDGDTFLPMVRKLTVDRSGKRGDESGFDGSKPESWGFNAAQDLQNIYYNFIGSAGGQFQQPDGTFVFDSEPGRTAFGYLVDLINKEKVSPAASNTNDNGDFTRDQFLQGKIALFESGTYNLKNVAEGAKFDWGIVPIPEGPAGRVSVVNNVIVAGNAATENRDAAVALLQWLGSPEGATFVGQSGAGLPAVTGAQQAYTDYWKGQDVDPTPFATQGQGQTIPAPTGANYSAAFTAWKPFFDEMFLGRTPVDEALNKAQTAANREMQG